MNSVNHLRSKNKLMKKSLRILIDAAKALDAGIIEEQSFKDIVFDYISEDETIIPNMLGILKRERSINSALLTETNLELSRVSSTMEMEKEWDDSTPKQRKKNETQKEWIYNQVIMHYHKWRDRIGHCFMDYKTLDEKYAAIPAEEKKKFKNLFEID